MDPNSYYGGAGGQRPEGRRDAPDGRGFGNIGMGRPKEYQSDGMLGIYSRSTEPYALGINGRSGIPSFRLSGLSHRPSHSPAESGRYDIPLKEFLKIFVRRSTLISWADEPFFTTENLSKFYVKYYSGISSKVEIGRIVQVVDFTDDKEYRYYLGNKRFSSYELKIMPKKGPTIGVRITQISDRPPSESEYNDWVRSCFSETSAGVYPKILPTEDDIRIGAELLAQLKNYMHTNSELSLIEEKRRRQEEMYMRPDVKMSIISGYSENKSSKELYGEFLEDISGEIKMLERELSRYAADERARSTDAGSTASTNTTGEARKRKRAVKHIKRRRRKKKRSREKSLFGRIEVTNETVGMSIMDSARRKEQEQEEKEAEERERRRREELEKKKREFLEETTVEELIKNNEHRLSIPEMVVLAAIGEPAAD